MNIGRSIVAILAGAITGIVLSLGTDVMLRAAGIMPPLGGPPGNAPLLLATVYRTVYGVLGAYIAARFAPSHPMRHAMILGCLGLVASVAGAAVAWNRTAEVGPRWYPLALVVLALPQSWAGAKIRESQLSGR